MDYSYGIQRALKYLEEHITEEIDYEQVAKCAYSSSFYFQRVFSAVCGVSIGEYVRNRRLSLAGNELAGGGKRVIDVAMKYGYDTPESFARAFLKFHGVSPSEVKAGAPHRIYSPLSVKITITGGKSMDYRIEKKEAFPVLVKKKRFPKEKEINGKEIPQFWAESMRDGTVEKLVPYVHPQNIFGDSIIGIGLEYNEGETDFPYGIGLHYNGAPVKEKEFEIVTIPASTFLVFPIQGRMPEAFRGVYEYLFTEFFPNSEYMPSGIEIEAYPSDDVRSEEYRWELWFSVDKK